MKTTKKEVEKTKKNTNYKAKFAGLYSLAVALAELATVYVFATQDSKVLWVLAGVLGVDAAQRLARAFVK